MAEKERKRSLGVTSYGHVVRKAESALNPIPSPHTRTSEEGIVRAAPAKGRRQKNLANKIDNRKGLLSP
ncbi:hypothetical protein CHS0354_032051 [Potamilus streckersoni]|uniref:Uncharacterized protein n=1 Tax=Potamilus streckersoni TaxID=2493646 RepID=A0AAE0TL64_9BIVA|nr:hypothetical protein CHS0354_032051 [Potamilus streckersoni]